MARPLRVEYPGAYYHVINRGNAGERIFVSDRDREKFLTYLEKAVYRFFIVIHTYCLMPNHYHLLIQTPQANLSSAIQWLNVSYAAYYNRKHQRSGHLFQGRFKALLLDADQYLKQLTRYVHLNPVRAGLVTEPGEYRWSSYQAFVGAAKTPGWLEVEWLLGVFGNKRKKAIKMFKNFVEGVDVKTVEDPNRNAEGGFILGDAEFIDWVKDKFLSDRKDEKEIPQLRNLRPKIALKTIVRAVCSEFRCDEEYVLKKGGKRNKARDIAIYIARSHSGVSCKKLGEIFGGTCGAAITMNYNRVSKEISQDKEVKRKVNKVKKRIFNI